MSIQHFNLPDPGEGLTEAEIVTWRVAAGDAVAVNDVVVEVETAKSLVELPIPFAGTVVELLAAEGDTVEVGSPIIAVETAEGGGAPSGGSDAASSGGSGEGGADDGAAESEGAVPNLVGYGAKESGSRRRRRRSAGSGGSAAPAAETAPASSSPAPASAAPAAGPQPAGAAGGASLSGEQARALAKPPVRKLAKDLGVDLSQVAPSGDGGVVTREDVESAAAGAGAASGAGNGSVAQPATSGGAGEAPAETRVPIKGVRKMTAQAMVSSAFTAPHVTEFVTLDCTATMDLVERLKADRAFADVKVSPLLVLARALCLVIRRHPEVNARWEEDAQEIAYLRDVNLGIAAATDRGLIVPNIKAADRMGLHELAVSLGELTATARAGRTPPADLAGGTITITNVGVFGVDTGAPILNPGEAAIIAFGAVRRTPWVVERDGVETIEPRWVTQLAMSFDHRLVDGELGSKVLADLAALLRDPGQAFLWA